MRPREGQENVGGKLLSPLLAKVELRHLDQARRLGRPDQMACVVVEATIHDPLHDQLHLVTDEFGRPTQIHAVNQPLFDRHTILPFWGCEPLWFNSFNSGSVREDWATKLRHTARIKGIKLGFHLEPVFIKTSTPSRNISRI